MKFAQRAVLVVTVFATCSLATAKLVIQHWRANGTPLPEIRLAGAMAGLFTGGAIASLLLILLVFGPPQEK